MMKNEVIKNMRNDELLRAIRENPHADADMFWELQDALQKESDKPHHKRDYEMIAALTDALYQATSSEDIDAVAARGIEKLRPYIEESCRHTEKRRPHIELIKYRLRLEMGRLRVELRLYIRYIRLYIEKLRRRTERMLSLAVRLKPFIQAAAIGTACLVPLGCFNNWSIWAEDSHTFPESCEFTGRSINFNFSKLNEHKAEDALPVHQEDDPFGIQAVLKERGVSVLTPTYIPEGFQFDVIDDFSSNCVDMRFVYRKKKAFVSVEYFQKSDQFGYENTKFTISSDYGRIFEDNIKGWPVIISWEDNQFSALFADDEQRIIYVVYVWYVSYEEGRKVLDSMFQ